MATLASVESGRHTFFRRMALRLSLFILFGFLQFAARGFVDYRTVPVWFHLHGAAMTCWLGLLVVQSTLADTGSLALHRRLGWSSAALVPVIWVLAIMAVTTALRVNLVPPFFTPAFFLALVTIETTMFAGMVAFAIACRRQTDWHSRLLLGATILLMEPALGRLLPMPLLGPWGQWLAMAIQLGVVGLIVRHDRRELGAVHQATWIAVLAVVVSHVATELAAMLPAVDSAARAIAAG
ncbi:MAG: hypothetical protein KGN34_10865 [Sphingomonadales bacterium]|nr:hypothetical protein [Sphingomonadales bacterium]